MSQASRYPRFHGDLRFGRRDWLLSTAGLAAVCVGCEKTDEESLAKASAHLEEVLGYLRHDVADVRSGLPKGAAVLMERAATGPVPWQDASTAREALSFARNKVQDLRLAKSTFFAIADANGKVLRNDREQDNMAEQDLFASFPGLRKALAEGYAEAIGSMEEARGVRGKPDRQWVAAARLTHEGAAQALYVTGWAWSSYCYRMEFALRAEVKKSLAQSRNNEPLLYCFALVDGAVISAPEAPQVNADTIASVVNGSHLASKGSLSKLLDITGRRFALVVGDASESIPGVSLGVLRSET